MTAPLRMPLALGMAAPLLASLLLAGGVGAVDIAQATQAKAPGGPPLLGAEAAGWDASLPQESSASAPPSSGDALAKNGLGSPLCADAARLGEPGRRNCTTSGFIAAPQPTGDYAFDVNINTGIGNLSNGASAIALDFAQQLWMAFVAMTHALIVMLEWCYSLNLLNGAVTSQVADALRSARLALTEPWMALVLAVAAGLAVYHGLIRRRVAETVGQALAMLAMMVVGLWVIADPAGTVGALQRWGDEGAAGTLAAAAGGTEQRAKATLASSMSDLFGAVVMGPWCYMEFGDVGWCEDASRLDPRLRRVALSIAGRLRAEHGCSTGCSAGALSATLLENARTNGELFLALPANEVQRNSTKERGTLLNVLCGGGPSADKCRGPTAAQAEFRSERGADSRLMGLASISLGALGMLLVFGLLAVRLLVAAVTTMLYLLLVPAVALAPALGDTGRSLFRAWTARLLGACVSKLAYSFLLGVLLTVNRMLLSLTALGWWAQWCLLCAFWWSAFAKRRHAFALLGRGSDRSPGRSRMSGWRAIEALELVRAVRRLVRVPSFRGDGA